MALSFKMAVSCWTAQEALLTGLSVMVLVSMPEDNPVVTNFVEYAKILSITWVYLAEDLKFYNKWFISLYFFVRL